MAKEKKVKTPKPKKKAFVENHGITGMGTDYSVYILSPGQRIMSLTAGLLVGFGVGYLYYNSVIAGAVGAVLAGWKAPSIYQKSLFKRRSDELRVQFRDMLESLSNSMTVGMTASRAFHAAYNDMVTEHGEAAYITKELQLMCNAHDNQGIEIKDMMNDFAARSGLDDARSFAGVFDVSTNLGGDIPKIVRETRDMIGEKIEVEMEIQTLVTGQKSQLNILTVMPLVMTVLMKCINTGADTTLTFVAKTIALGMFIFAYWIGTKMVDIKV